MEERAIRRTTKNVEKKKPGIPRTAEEAETHVDCKTRKLLQKSEGQSVSIYVVPNKGKQIIVHEMGSLEGEKTAKVRSRDVVIPHKMQIESVIHGVRVVVETDNPTGDDPKYSITPRALVKNRVEESLPIEKQKTFSQSETETLACVYKRALKSVLSDSDYEDIEKKRHDFQFAIGIPKSIPQMIIKRFFEEEKKKSIQDKKRGIVSEGPEKRSRESSDRDDIGALFGLNDYHFPSPISQTIDTEIDCDYPLSQPPNCFHHLEFDLWTQDPSQWSENEVI
jgi:hypothetical protein